MNIFKFQEGMVKYFTQSAQRFHAKRAKVLRKARKGLYGTGDILVAVRQKREKPDPGEVEQFAGYGFRINF